MNRKNFWIGSILIVTIIGIAFAIGRPNLKRSGIQAVKLAPCAAFNSEFALDGSQVCCGTAVQVSPSSAICLSCAALKGNADYITDISDICPVEFPTKCGKGKITINNQCVKVSSIKENPKVNLKITAASQASSDSQGHEFYLSPVKNALRYLAFLKNKNGKFGLVAVSQSPYIHIPYPGEDALLNNLPVEAGDLIKFDYRFAVEMPEPVNSKAARIPRRAALKGAGTLAKNIVGDAARTFLAALAELLRLNGTTAADDSSSGWHCKLSSAGAASCSPDGKGKACQKGKPNDPKCAMLACDNSDVGGGGVCVMGGKGLPCKLQSDNPHSDCNRVDYKTCTFAGECIYGGANDRRCSDEYGVLFAPNPCTQTFKETEKKRCMHVYDYVDGVKTVTGMKCELPSENGAGFLDSPCFDNRYCDIKRCLRKTASSEVECTYERGALPRVGPLCRNQEACTTKVCRNWDKQTDKCTITGFGDNTLNASCKEASDCSHLVCGYGNICIRERAPGINQCNNEGKTCLAPTPTPTPTPSLFVTTTPLAVSTKVPTAAPTKVVTPSATPTVVFTSVPTSIPTVIPPSPTPVPATATPSRTPTKTPTKVPATSTAIPTIVATIVPNVPTNPPPPSPSATASPTATATETPSPMPTPEETQGPPISSVSFSSEGA